MLHPSVAVFEHQIVAYKRTWRGSVFSSFLLPALFLVAMGKSVGGYVDARSALGTPYVDYIAPGVLASTAMQVAIFESTFPVFSGFQWGRTYYGMLASPLRTVDILAGHLAFVLVRVAMSATGFLILMVAFGTVHSPLAVLALPVSVLLGCAVGAPVFGYSAVISTDSMFAILFRFAMIPMSLFAGVFFPVDSMPLVARLLAYVSPLWHGVELCRAVTLGTATAWGAPVHAGYLAVWAVAGFALARVAFVRKLTD